MTPVARSRALTVGYDGVVVTAVPDLSIGRGDRVVIMGRNGSGKTTLLKTFAGLIRPVSGELDAPPAGAHGAIYVHPTPFLFAGSGRHNVMLAARGDHDEAMRAIEALGATAFAGADVRTLSTGQRQRLALARALAARPRLLLVDEPETGLDAAGLEAWGRVLRERGDVAIVMASHRPVAGAATCMLDGPHAHEPSG